MSSLQAVEEETKRRGHDDDGNAVSDQVHGGPVVKKPTQWRACWVGCEAHISRCVGSLAVFLRLLTISPRSIASCPVMVDSSALP